MAPSGNARIHKSPEKILKDRASLSPEPNLLDYEGECARFEWARAWKLLEGLPGKRGFNIAHEAVDQPWGASVPMHSRLAFHLSKCNLDLSD